MNLGESATLLAVARNAEDDADEPSSRAVREPRREHDPRRHLIS